MNPRKSTNAADPTPFKHSPSTVALGMLLVAALTLYLSSAPPGLTWQHDEGDLAAAAFTGGNPHPHGYPTYMFVARLAIVLQEGNVALRLSRLSAFCGALAAALVTLFTYRFIVQMQLRQHLTQEKITGTAPVAILASAILAGLLYATLPIVWTQAILIEMYALASIFSALHLLLGAALLQRIEHDRRIPIRGTIIFGILIGVGFGAHATTLVAAFAVLVPLVAALLRVHLRDLIRFMVLLVGGALLGLLVFAVLPLSANRSVTSNWGDASTWEGFLWMVSAAAYRNQIVWRFSLEKWAFLISWIATQFSLPVLLIAIYGFWAIWDRRRAVAIGIATAFLLNCQFLTMYDVTNVFAYLLPALMLLAICFAVAISAWVARLGWSVPLAVLCWCMLLVAHNSPQVSLKDDHAAQAYIDQAMNVVPAGAFIFSGTDRTTFALWYAQAVQSPEKRLMVIEARMLYLDWYRNTLARFNPNVASDWWALPLTDLIDRLVERGIPVYCTFDPARYGISARAAGSLYIVLDVVPMQKP